MSDATSIPAPARGATRRWDDHRHCRIVGRGHLRWPPGLRAGCLPKVGRGWFLRAGSFEAVAGLMATDHLSVSHGEGFAGLISERMGDQGLYILDEPEVALSARRQAELLAFLPDIQATGDAEDLMATHSRL